uniref:SANT domain-containing protein n=1 Tax=Steinernema glaseri TaxID=37863 RepID=A0A1I7Y761_9BILA
MSSHERDSPLEHLKRLKRWSPSPLEVFNSVGSITGYPCQRRYVSLMRKAPKKITTGYFLWILYRDNYPKNTEETLGLNSTQFAPMLATLDANDAEQSAE